MKYLKAFKSFSWVAMVQQGSSKLLLLWHHGRLDAHRLYNFILMY